MTSAELLDKINSITNDISMATGRIQEIEKNLLEMGVSQDQINLFKSNPAALSSEIEKHRNVINDLVEKRNQIISEVTPLLGDN